MIDLFSPEGHAALERLGRQRTLYAFDFDGTLSPIVARPEDAIASPTTVALLASLGERAPTVLLTGRAADDMRQRIDFTPTFLVGNHGAEGMPASLSDHRMLAAHREVVERWLSQWSAAASAAAVDPAVLMEPKAYSASIHYRSAADPDDAAKAIVAAIERLDPRPFVIGGKCVFNLLPEGAPDKGKALAALVRFARCEAAFFIGDDVTDELAFIDAPASWVTVRVGRSAHSAARYFIADQRDIDRCLESLIATTA
jgi:trehalose 6-phosphate phosphatase